MCIRDSTPTAHVAEALARRIIDSDILPDGALQFVAGRIDGLFALLDEQDSVSFTGSAATARLLRADIAALDRGTRFSPKPTRSTPPCWPRRPGPTPLNSPSSATRS